MGRQSFGTSDALSERVREVLKRIKYKVAVVSGKGGVGKSLVSSYTAVALARRGLRVGLLDVDFHGPSSHIFLGLRNARPRATLEWIEPVEGPLGIRVMSVAFLTPEEDTPVIWRGPLKSSAIVELLTKVNWGDLDFMIVDLPPGTGDEALTLAQVVRDVDGSIVVAMPSTVVKSVVSRAINFVKYVGLRPIGLVENMSFFYCPDSGRRYEIFGESAVEELSAKYGIPVIARIPVDPRLSEYVETGRVLILEEPDSPLSRSFEEIASRLLAELERVQSGAGR